MSATINTQTPEPSRAGPVKAINDSNVVRNEGQRTEMPRERFHFGLPQGKLTVWNADPTKHYHWINDTPGRIEMALASGYTFTAKESVQLVPGVTPKDSDLGSRVSAIVGSLEDNSPLRAYLMETPIELYEENQRRLQERVDASETAIKRGKTTGQEDGSFYVPAGQPIRMSTKNGN